MGSSHCSLFFEEYDKGKTPCLEKEPIKLCEYGGRFWVAEGKHRICAARRYGVKEVEAQVYPLPHDSHSILPEQGTPGRFRFRYAFTIGNRKSYRGDMAVLWVQTPRAFSPNSFGDLPLRLDGCRDTDGKMVTLFPGLSYCVSRNTVRKGFLNKRANVIVETEVLIEPSHYNTRIWLMKGPANSFRWPNRVSVVDTETIFRFGLWRTSHLAFSINTEPNRVFSGIG